MSARRQLRRLVIAPAVVSIVGASLSAIGPTATSAAATSQSGTTRTVQLRGQSSTFPAPGAVDHGKAANLTEDGLNRYPNHSNSPRPQVTHTAGGARTLAGSGTGWVPNVTPSLVHSTNTGSTASWEGLNEANNDRTAGFSLEPPDQGLCVGAGRVLETINDVVRVYKTDGSTASPVVSLNAFFHYPEGFDPNTGQYGPFLTDPSCAYDAATQRFFVTELTLDVDPDTGFLTLANHLDIAVSKTNNPAGATSPTRSRQPTPAGPTARRTRTARVWATSRIWAWMPTASSSRRTSTRGAAAPVSMATASTVRRSMR